MDMGELHEREGVCGGELRYVLMEDNGDRVSGVSRYPASRVPGKPWN